MSLSPSSWRVWEGDRCAADPSAQVFDKPEGFCDLSGSRTRQERLPSRLVRLSGSARAYKSDIYTAVEHISIREITCLTGYLPSLSPGFYPLCGGRLRYPFFGGKVMSSVSRTRGSDGV